MKDFIKFIKEEWKYFVILMVLLIALIGLAFWLGCGVGAGRVWG